MNIFDTHDLFFSTDDAETIKSICPDDLSNKAIINGIAAGPVAGKRGINWVVIINKKNKITAYWCPVRKSPENIEAIADHINRPEIVKDLAIWYFRYFISCIGTEDPAATFAEMLQDYTETEWSLIDLSVLKYFKGLQN